MTEPSPDDTAREQRLQRNLKTLVGALGALIVLGIAAVGWRATNIASTPRAAFPNTAASTVTALATPGGEILLELPKGAKVTIVAISGNRLAVTYDSPSGTGIAVLDLDTGQRIATIKTIDAVPRN